VYLHYFFSSTAICCCHSDFVLEVRNIKQFVYKNAKPVGNIVKIAPFQRSSIVIAYKIYGNPMVTGLGSIGTIRLGNLYASPQEDYVEGSKEQEKYSIMKNCLLVSTLYPNYIAHFTRISVSETLNLYFSLSAILCYSCIH
jgi:hypothetical protein